MQFKNDALEKSKKSFSKKTKGDTWNYSNTVQLKTPSWTQLMLVNDGYPYHFIETRNFVWRTLFFVSFLFSEKKATMWSRCPNETAIDKRLYKVLCYWIILSPLPNPQARGGDNFSCRSIKRKAFAEYEKLHDVTENWTNCGILR